MRLIKFVSVVGVCAFALFLTLSVGNVDMTGTALAEPPGEDQPTQIDPSALGDLAPTLAVEPNDYCRNAERLQPLILIMPGQPAPTPDHYTVSASDQQFANGNNVDDWYVYRTHDLGCDTDLKVEVTSDKAQTEVEIYEYCFQWPRVTSMYQEVYYGFETSIEPLSGLDKEITLHDALAEHDYYIHVNCLMAPDDGGPITYTLTITEECAPPPAR